MISVIETTEQGTSEWLAARISGIGGSEVATIMGANPYATPLDVWMAKVMPSQGVEQNLAMQVGHELEPFVAGLWAADHPAYTLTKPPALIRHPEVACAIASLDYLAISETETIVVEVKTTQQDWLSLPERVWWQVQWQMACAGLERAEVAVLVRNREFRTFSIEADRFAQDQALADVQRFWNEHVITKVMPEIDPVRDHEAMDKLWTAQPAKEAEVDWDLVRRWLDLKASAAALKTDIEEIEGRIKMAMADATEGMADGQLVLTWRETRGRTSIDVEALKRDGIYERYLKQGSTYRTLRAVRRSS
jgi:putative phage-type endonuclease